MASLLLTSSYDEAAAHSRSRREALWCWPHPYARPGFAWVKPPVLNPFTRIAAEMCAATGTVRAIGYEQGAGSELPRPVTQVCEIASMGARLPA